MDRPIQIQENQAEEVNRKRRYKSKKYILERPKKIHQANGQPKNRQFVIFWGGIWEKVKRNPQVYWKEEIVNHFNMKKKLQEFVFEEKDLTY